GIKMSVFSDTGEDINNFAAMRPGISHPVCGQEGQMKAGCQIDQRLVNFFFATDEMPLQLNKNVFRTECTDKELRAVAGILRSAGALACTVRRLGEAPRAQGRVPGE